MGSVLRLEDETGLDSLEVTPICGGLVEVEIDDSFGTAAIALTTEQAEHLEATLYRWRLGQTFDNKKEDGAHSIPGPGPELERGTGTPPHP